MHKCELCGREMRRPQVHRMNKDGSVEARHGACAEIRGQVIKTEGGQDPLVKAPQSVASEILL